MFGLSGSKSLGKGIKLVGLKLYCFFQAIMTALKIFLQCSHITPADTCLQNTFILVSSSCEHYQQTDAPDLKSNRHLELQAYHEVVVVSVLTSSDFLVFTWNIYTILSLVGSLMDLQWRTERFGITKAIYKGDFSMLYRI